MVRSGASLERLIDRCASSRRRRGTFWLARVPQMGLLWLCGAIIEVAG